MEADFLMKLDVLAFGAHPDDVELSLSGTLAKLTQLGHRTGVVDMVQGELGTRGNSKIRAREARASAEVLGLKIRKNLALKDGYLHDTTEARLKVIEQVRKYRPRLVFTHYWDDPHPDHVSTSQIVTSACYLSGLKKIETGQQRFRPDRIVYFRLPHYVHPSFLVDISIFFEKKMQAIRCFASQLYNPKSRAPQTYLSLPEFLPRLEALDRHYGSLINTGYAEAFYCKETLAVGDPVAFLTKFREVTTK